MAAQATVPDTSTLREIFTLMSRVKICDEHVRRLMSSGQIFIIYYSPRGQEAIAAGVSVHLRPDDYVVTTYRGLHDQIAKGVDMRGLWAELLGKEDGLCKGKGGPMHITDPASGLMVTSGIVGGGIPIANGLALAQQLEGGDRLTVVNFGDGATNIGAFHEAMNLAALWKLPIVFVCQNNLYAEHTSFAGGTAGADVSARAGGYGMPSARIDGNDPLAVHAAAGEAIERARSGAGPTLLECMTYRFHGHLLGDAMEYMPAEEREAAMAADPVPRFRQWLLDEGHLDEGELAAIEAEITTEIEEAADAAIASSPPPVEELLTDVYAGVAAR